MQKKKVGKKVTRKKTTHMVNLRNRISRLKMGRLKNPKHAKKEHAKNNETAVNRMHHPSLIFRKIWKGVLLLMIAIGVLTAPLMMLVPVVLIINQIEMSYTPYSYVQISSKGFDEVSHVYTLNTFDKNGAPAAVGEYGSDEAIPIGTWLKVKVTGYHATPAYLKEIPESEVPKPAIAANKQRQKETKENGGVDYD
ncbi:hypothetical protein D3P96_01700 [Weissella viridescens]|uniref:Uncharacterized protein n=1 Tax=Weissella viridescens TaxID=1629 RepID=A0A3P2RDM8_WEIVI|nr:hypothetical protein [Weissella viridescens]RRG18724.1 hypothetical protein D3P96_01700 [Weissella viridescens]